MSDKLKIGISVGDVNGIGFEIIIKTLADSRMLDYMTPIVYGNTKTASFHRKSLEQIDLNFNVINHASQANDRRANMINCWQEEVKLSLGEANETGGKYAFLSLERAVSDLLNQEIDALVTAPINKESIQGDNFKFPGHTEYLQSKSNADESLMFMISDELKVGVATGHVALKDVASGLSTESIVKKLVLMNESLKNDFWIQKPKIAVLGLNPHAGDQGLIGTEEQNIIGPAIEKANEAGVFTFGPYAADGFFAGEHYHKFDGILAMYHDQGLIPFKHIAGQYGVNFTAGLPFVRTSPRPWNRLRYRGKKQSF